MALDMIACGIFQPEMESILRQLKEEKVCQEDINLYYVDPGLHVDYDKLKTGILGQLEKSDSPRRILLFGSMCHPDLLAFTEDYDIVRMEPGNCVDMVFGKERQAELEASARVFYLTLGWLKNWRRIFVAGQGWDEVDARQNMGFYDKIVLLDTGVMTVDDEDLLAFFEFTQIPIEIVAVDLSEFKEHIKQAVIAVSHKSG